MEIPHSNIIPAHSAASNAASFVTHTGASADDGSAEGAGNHDQAHHIALDRTSTDNPEHLHDISPPSNLGNRGTAAPLVHSITSLPVHGPGIPEAVPPPDPPSEHVFKFNEARVPPLVAEQNCVDALHRLYTFTCRDLMYILVAFLKQIMSENQPHDSWWDRIVRLILLDPGVRSRRSSGMYEEAERTSEGQGVMLDRTMWDNVGPLTERLLRGFGITRRELEESYEDMAGRRRYIRLEEDPDYRDITQAAFPALLAHHVQFREPYNSQITRAINAALALAAQLQHEQTTHGSPNVMTFYDQNRLLIFYVVWAMSHCTPGQSQADDPANNLAPMVSTGTRVFGISMDPPSRFRAVRSQTRLIASTDGGQVEEEAVLDDIGEIQTRGINAITAEERDGYGVELPDADEHATDIEIAAVGVQIARVYLPGRQWNMLPMQTRAEAVGRPDIQRSPEDLVSRDELENMIVEDFRQHIPQGSIPAGSWRRGNAISGTQGEGLLPLLRESQVGVEVSIVRRRAFRPWEMDPGRPMANSEIDHSPHISVEQATPYYPQPTLQDHAEAPLPSLEEGQADQQQAPQSSTARGVLQGQGWGDRSMTHTHQEREHGFHVLLRSIPRGALVPSGEPGNNRIPPSAGVSSRVWPDARKLSRQEISEWNRKALTEDREEELRIVAESRKGALVEEELKLQGEAD